MILSKTSVRMLGFILLTVTLFMMGPSLVDFTSSSIIEFLAFYVHIWVIFFAGIFMRGKANRRAILVLVLSIIANHYLFYAYLEWVQGYTYAKLWCMFVAGLPMYLAFTYYTYFQSRCLAFFERIGLSDSVADRIVGPIGTTNFWILCSCYATFWAFGDFFIAVYSSVYGLVYSVPAIDGRVTAEFLSNGHVNVYIVYDSVIVVVDSVFAVLVAHRVLRDQKRPDALGIGRSMTWDKSRVKTLNRVS